MNKAIVDYERLLDQFRKVFESRWDQSELENYSELREKFAFHMADISVNMTGLAESYQKPGSCSVECLAEQVTFFFYHAVPHLMAAANIFDHIPQTFDEQAGVHDWSGVVEDDEANAAENESVPEAHPS